MRFHYIYLLFAYTHIYMFIFVAYHAKRNAKELKGWNLWVNIIHAILEIRFNLFEDPYALE